MAAGCSPNSDDNNSVHVGLNGQAIATADWLSTTAYGAWGWFKGTLDGPVATLQVAERRRARASMCGCGRTASGWTALLLTTNASLTPSGVGPAESPRAGTPGVPATPTGLTATPGATTIALGVDRVERGDGLQGLSRDDDAGEHDGGATERDVAADGHVVYRHDGGGRDNVLLCRDGGERGGRVAADGGGERDAHRAESGGAVCRSRRVGGDGSRAPSATIGRGGKSWAINDQRGGVCGQRRDGGGAGRSGSTLINTGYVTAESPELHYRVQFATAGTYHVWLRALPNGDDNNSVHVGLNGQAMATADRLSTTQYGGWAWFKSTLDGPVATLQVPSAGEHVHQRVDAGRRLPARSAPADDRHASLVPTGPGPPRALARAMTRQIRRRRRRG